jgi:tRNA pseudouridine55 synthase
MNGIVLLDKPLGLSSNRALQTVKHLLGASKAGHVGSLDPLATGMLPICLGEATKIAGEILSGRKHYQFTVKLGARTATGDAEGEVIETSPVPSFSQDEVAAVLERFKGTQQQTPPMYSALKKDGQPLYKLARAGQEVERAPRSIEIFELALEGEAGADPETPACTLSLGATCSKGTYIRVLAEDIAQALGTCGHVIKLRRAWVEPFANEPMQSLEDVERAPCILPADRGVPQLPRLDLSAEDTVRLRHGQPVTLRKGSQGAESVRLYDSMGEFFGIGALEGVVLRPRRLWVEGSTSRIPRLLKG